MFPPTAQRSAITKIQLVEYYLSVADGALRGVADRPMILKRFVKGITHEAVFQKRAPQNRPDWVDVAELRYASAPGRRGGDPLCRRVGLGGQPGGWWIQSARRPGGDLDHPRRTADRPRPHARVPWTQILEVAGVVRESSTTTD